MTPTRAALILPALVLVLSGCGAVSTLTLRATTQGVAYADTTQHLPASRRDARGDPAGRRRSRYATTVATVPGVGGSEWLEILNGSGAVIAKTAIHPTATWMTAAGRRRRLLGAGRRGA